MTSCKKDHVSTPAGLTVTNITDSSCKISWLAGDADSYQLFLFTDANYSNPVAGYNPLVVSGTTASPSDLAGSTKYYVKLQAVKGGRNSDAAYTDFTTLDADWLVFAGCEDKKLYAFSARNGSIKWSYTTGGPINSTPAVYNNTVYVGSDDGKIYAFNAADGALKWSYLTSRAIFSGAPIVKNGILYMGNFGGKLYALDAGNGTAKWTYQVPGPYPDIGGSAVVQNGVVYIASYDGKLYAIDALSGALKWVSASTGNPVDASPAIFNNVLYVGAVPKVYAFDALTGATKWVSTQPPFTQYFSSPTIYNNNVYIGGIGGSVFVYDALTGALKFNWYLSPGMVMSSPVIVNGVLYVGSGDGVLFALDATTGNAKWSNTGMGIKNIYSGPVVSDKYVYAGTLDGAMFAVDINTGVTKWSKAIPGGRIQSSPCVVTYSGKVFYPGISGEVQ